MPASGSPATSSTISTRSSTSSRSSAPRLRGVLAAVHPFPSALNAILVFGLAVVASAYETPAGPPNYTVAGLLAGAMLLTHFAIGALNDWWDVEGDQQTKPSKPIPAGLITRRQVAVVGLLAGGAGLLVCVGVPAAPQPLTVGLLAVTLTAGLAYDAWLKPTGLSWLPFSVAFTLLPLYAWFGASGGPPPRAELLLPVAFLAGPALQLANGLVDIERDRAAGVGGLVPLLGRRRGWTLMAALQLVINALAWITVGPVLVANGVAGTALLAAASSVTLLGVVLSASVVPARREWGWRFQAVGIVLLALGWLSAVVNEDAPLP